jgi:serine/threonine protein kinase
MLGGKQLYTRGQNGAAKLDDFKILKMIGKGTFGKVFLVEQMTRPGKLYAMKCIRKDIIIENEQMENI